MNRLIHKLTFLALFAALAYAAMVLGRIPLVLFLCYDPKDVVIALGGFLLGPISAFFISLFVSFIEMLTVSETGPLGFLMNVMSTCAFACVASSIYRKRKTAKSALLGLACGCVSMAIVMLIWNYWMAPLYLGASQEAVSQLLLPAFLPFNLIKGSINALLTFILYRPTFAALSHTHLLPTPEPSDGHFSVAAKVLAIFVLSVTVVLLFLTLFSWLL